MNGNHDIFISFCSSDVPSIILDEVVGCVQRHGKKVYCFDRDESNLAEDIKDNLEIKILESNAVFVIITLNAVKSMWIDFEINCAIKHNKKVVAICDDGFPDENFPTKLRDKVALKYKAVEGLRQRLKRFL
jgi:TIR domain